MIKLEMTRMLRNGKRLSQVFHHNDKFMQVQTQHWIGSDQIELNEK